MMNTNKLPYLASAFVLLLIGILYFVCAPTTVQYGDTGELVTNSYFLRVSHPPGYPLWTLLYHLPVRYLSFSTPFHIASIVTILISLAWLGILAFKFKNEESLALIGVVATNIVFWRYSVLPDVFSLHMFFLTIVFLGFLKPELLSRPWFIFLTSLCVAHHHTILFVFPMYIYAFIQGHIKRNLFYSVLFGCLSFSLYFTLMYFHPYNLGSWGIVENAKDVINHFLRKDYGTFNLHTQGNNDLSWIRLFLMVMLTDFWSVLLALAYMFIRFWNDLRPYRSKLLIISLCLFFYFLIFYFTGVMSMNKFGESVFERFLMQPFLLLAFLLLVLINVARLKLPRILLLCLLVNTGTNLMQNFSVNDYSKNTVVEDFLTNNFRIIPNNSVYYTVGDTWGFSTYYIHEVLKVRPDVLFFFNNLSFGWTLPKVAATFPDAFPVWKTTMLDSLNFEKYSFYTNQQPGQIPEYLQLSYHGILFKLSKSDTRRPEKKYECDLGDKYSWRFRPKLEDLQKVEFSRVFDLMYADCNLIKGNQFLAEKKYDLAAAEFFKAVKLSPLSTVYQERLCATYKLLEDPLYTECERRLDELIMGSSQQYYLYKFYD